MKENSKLCKSMSIDLSFQMEYFQRTRVHERERERTSEYEILFLFSTSPMLLFVGLEAV